MQTNQNQTTTSKTPKTIQPSQLKSQNPQTTVINPQQKTQNIQQTPSASKQQHNKHKVNKLHPNSKPRKYLANK